MATSTSTSNGYALSSQQRAAWLANPSIAEMWAGAWRPVATLPASPALHQRYAALATSREILRTSFAIAGDADEPLQVVDDDARVATIDVDLSGLCTNGADADPVDALLRRCRYLAAGEPTHCLVLRLRLADGAPGLAVLMRALTADRHTLASVMERLVSGGPTRDDDAEAQHVQYVDYVGWQDSLRDEASAADAAAAWRAALAGAEGSRAAMPPRAASGLARSRERTVRVIATAHEWTQVSEECRAHRIEPGIAIGARWLTALADAGVAPGGSVFVEVDARQASELPGFLGPMMHWIPLPVAGGDGRGLLACCQVIGRTLETLGPWVEHMPVQAGGALPRAGASDTVGFSVRPERHDEAVRFSNADAFCALTLRWRERHGRLLLDVSARHPHADRLPDLAAHLLRALRQPIAPPRPRSTSLAAAVDEHARRQTDRVAVVCGDETVTYAALARRSDAVARALAARGVAAGAVVGLHLPPSIDLVTGLLGIAKAGATFLPIDVRTPARRIQSMLDQAAAALVLTAAPQDLPSAANRSLLSVPAAAAEGRSLDAPPPVLDPDRDAIAYILFTSGSTGQPKGVAVSWGAVANYLAWGLDTYAMDEGMSVVHTSIGFDLTLTTLLGPLVAGASTCLVPETNDLAAFARILERQPRLSFLKVTPAQLRLLDDRLSRAHVPPPKVLIVGGEALRFEDLGAWPRSGRVTVINEYGPTEATVGCCCHSLRELPAVHGPVPIGRPIRGASIHLLDGALHPVRAGARGEIFIAGDGLARGYVNAPHLTAERFLPDPFAATPGARMYRTGDFASSGADEVLVYHGRQDDQIKIRGHRVELAEVAAQLETIPGVSNAFARTVPGAGGEPGLAGYVVLGPEAFDARRPAAATAHLDEWRRVFDDSYRAGHGQRFAGWSSSYTGEPIPDREMQAWVDETVAALHALSPRRLLEIGCGNGLLAARLAPHVDAYTGTDISAAALDDLSRELSTLDVGACAIRLDVGAAHEFAWRADETYDTIVLNSVVQYFPDVSYLTSLIEQCRAHLAPGGRLFIGDVRNADLLDTFHFSIEAHRGGRAGTAGDLRRRVQQQVYAEGELTLGPAFFLDLSRALGFTAVDISLKRSRYDNELTRFRYDVVLRTDDAARADALTNAVPVAEWTTRIGSLERLRASLLQERADAMVITGIPNGRIDADAERWQRLAGAPDDTPVQTMLDAPSSRVGVDPADIFDVAMAAGYESRASWSCERRADIDVLLWRRGTAAPSWHGPRHAPGEDTRVRANRPLAPKIAADLLAESRAFLKERLPDYMMPGYLLVLDAFPLNQHGKIAVGQLPPPNVARPVAAGFVAPETPLEARLCRVWEEVLGVDRVGVETSFFKLGGHSLLAIKLAYRVRTECGCDVSLRQLFEAQTVRTLARVIAAATPPAPPGAGQVVEAQEVLDVEPEAWFEPFPLTDVQQAYVAGRSPEYGLGGVAAHCYLEFDARGLDVLRLESALNRLTSIHGMLRSVVRADGTQQVLRRVPGYRFAVDRLDALSAADRERALLRLRRRMSHQVLPLGRWPLLDVRVSLLSPGVARLHLSLDNLLFDGLSMEILAAHLCTLYDQPLAMIAPPPVAFRDCVVHDRRQREREGYRSAQNYWRRRLPEFPAPPELPRAAADASPGVTRFHRLAATLPAARWEAIKALAREQGITPSSVLCAAFAEVLAMWSKTDRFCVHLTFFNRRPIHPRINEVVGDFTSLTLLDVDGTRPGSFVVRARAIQAQIAADLEHSLPGGVWFLRELARFHASRRPQPAIVFTSTIGLERIAPKSTATLPVEQVFSTSQTPQVGLDHSVYESRGALHLTWDYAVGLFLPDMPEEMFAAYVGYLDRLAAAPAAWHDASRPELPPAARATIAAVNATSWTHPGGLLQDGIWRQVEAQPAAVAIRTPTRGLTYGALGAHAAGLMMRLLEAGASPGDLVAIFIEKGWEQSVAALAITSLGAAYVPLDPAWPDDRVRRVLRQCTPRAVIVRGATGARLAGCETIAIDIAGVAPSDASRRPRVATADGDPLAYVLFTSGTTGTPKGVAIRHSGAVNTIRDLLDRFHIGSSDRCLQLSNLTFDLSVFDIFGTLSAGGTLVLPRDAQWDPEHWHELISAHGVTIWNSVPTLFDMYVLHLAGKGATASPLRVAFLSGDWIPVPLSERARAVMPGLDVISLGGATEASIWSVAYPIRDIDRSWKSVPYGTPMRNQELYVVDRQLSPRPIAVVGQIAIAGIGLAEGYWRDPEMTAARFRISPALGKRLYLTGDLGRLHADGNLEILGREDNQVKIHGYRIELGDVEAALIQAPSVKDAAARAVATRDGAGRRLVAYVVADGGVRDEAALRAHLSQSLPPYMVPADIVFLDALPVTSNGKIDRQALPLPELDRAPASGAPFQDELERELAGAWRQALGVMVADRDADFFASGGDSMKTIQVMNWIRHRFGREVPLRGFLAEPTIAAMAAQLRTQNDTAVTARTPAAPRPAAEARETNGSFPLTDVQFSYWVGRSDTTGMTRASSHAYNEFKVYDLPWHAFEAGYVALLRRHEMLRCQVGPDGRQSIAPLTSSHLPKFVDLQGLDDRVRDRALARLRRGLSHRAYPAAGGPLQTLVAARLPAGETVLHLSMDLLICDAYSARVINRDLAALLTANGHALPRLETSFRDAVRAAGEFEQTAEFERARAYWLSRLEAFPPAPSLPLRARGRTRTRSRFTRHEWQMPAAGWSRLRLESTRRGLTPSGLLCSAFGQILGMWSAHRRFAINVTLFDRFPHHPQVNELVGVFTTTFLLEVEHQRMPFAAFARQVQSRLWADIEHRHFNGVKFMRALRKRGALDGAGYPVVFTSTLGGGGDTGARAFPWRGESTYAISQTSGVLLDCQIAEAGGAMYLNWDVVEDAFEAGSVPRMFGTFTRLLRALDTSDQAWNMECR